MHIADFGIIDVIMTVMIYLDHSRRADLTRIDDRLDRLTAVVTDLVKAVGELKGRVDVTHPAEALPASD